MNPKLEAIPGRQHHPRGITSITTTTSLYPHPIPSSLLPSLLLLVLPSCERQQGGQVLVWHDTWSSSRGR
ncbi:unnamed protein product, partial [Closterium sp. NIES-54]